MNKDRLNYLLDLQYKYKSGMIDEDEINEEDKKDLINLYKIQNLEKSKENKKRLLEILNNKYE